MTSAGSSTRRSASRSTGWIGSVSRGVVFGLLEPGGALVHVDTVVDDPAAAAPADRCGSRVRRATR